MRSRCFGCDRRTVMRHKQHGVAYCRQCQKRPLVLLTRTDAKEQYKVTQCEIETIPTITEEYVHGRHRVVRKLVARQRVEALAASEPVQERLAKQERRSSSDVIAERDAVLAWIKSGHLKESNLFRRRGLAIE